MNPTVGHLYHDFSISNAFTYLDAKEQLRTRQINAREKKQLDKYTKVLDRAMFVCKRKHEYEETIMKQQLQVIKSKTPSLDRGLRQETERQRRYETISGCSLPSIAQSRATTTTTCATGSTLKNSSYRSKTIESPLSYRTSHNESSKIQQSYLNSSYHGQTMLENTQNVDQHTANFCKRAEHVTRNLHKLYRRQKERLTSKKHFIDILRADNMELLMKAKIFFKDTEAEAVLESLLAGNEEPEPETNDVPLENDTEEAGDIVSIDYFSKHKLSSQHGNENTKLTEPNVKKFETNKIISNRLDESAESDADSSPVSSTVANPSVASLQLPKTRTKWREIFKMPELWRPHAQRMKERNSKKQKSSSLVTITAKYRRTMVK